MKNFTVLILLNFSFCLSSPAQNGFEIKTHNRVIQGTKPKVSSGKVQGNSLQRSGLVYSGSSLLSDLKSVQSGRVAVKTKTVKQPTNTLTIHRSAKTGQPIFIKGTPAHFSTYNVLSSASEHPAAKNYLNTIAPILNIKNPTDHFIVNKTETDPRGGTIVRLKQYYQSIEVYGHESIIHLSAEGKPLSWNGTYANPTSIKSTDFKITETAAAKTSLEDVKQNAHFYELSAAEKAFLSYQGPDIQKVLYTDIKLVKTCVPAYIIHIRPNFVDWWMYVIDANTGNILDAHSNTCHINGAVTGTATDLNGVTQTVHSYLQGSTYYLVDASRPMFNATKSVMPNNPVGGIQTLDLNYTWGSNTSYINIQSTDANTWTPTATSAHYNAGKAFDYYTAIHNRNSIDGNGGTIISFINVANPNDGTPMDNAFWNGQAMYYGNGNTAFKPLAGGLDVGGHEMTHGVVQSTANLTYQGESGAINESMADIFGCMIDSTNWTIGEKIVLLSAYPSGALRSLSDPHNGGTGLGSPGWQPRILSEIYTGTADNGGVHINSGITSYAFYLLSQATKRTSAEKIFYRALTTYLTRSSQFIDLRLSCIAAADDIFGKNSNESIQTGNAFTTVQIVGDSSSITTQVNEFPINPGTEYLLAYDINPQDSTSLYQDNSTTFSNRTTLSTQDFYNKPSVTDNGSIFYFINGDNQIASQLLTPGNQKSIIVDTNKIWNNVAVSKDGKRLAATSLSKDTSIYVLDLGTNNWTTFILYSPTFSTGIKGGGPVYADALEWDHTGQFLVYDCYNNYKNTGGDSITFWDINFIQVWDNTLNTTSDGTITKLFASLPAQVSIGNPTFSKNSPEIIAFDYVDEAS